MPRHLKSFQNFILIILALSLALLGIERLSGVILSQKASTHFLVRHMDRDIDFTGYEADRKLFWKICPNVNFRLELEGRPTTLGQSNRYGLRGPDFSLEKEAGEKRILFLGDSSTFGLFLNDGESYPSLVEVALNQGKDGPWRAINAAVTGYSSHQLLVYLREYGLRFSPDVICVCVGNNDFSARYVSDRECSQVLSDADRSTAVWRLIKLAWIRLRLYPWFPWKPRAMLRATPEAYRENLEMICDLAKGAEAKTVIVAYPGRFPASQGYIARLEGMANPIAKAVARERGCPFVELAGLRASGPVDNQRFFADAIHPNRLGHQLIAQKVVNAMVDNHLVFLSPKAMSDNTDIAN